MTFKTRLKRSHFYPHLPRYLFLHLTKLRTRFLPPQPLAQSASKPCWLPAVLRSDTQEKTVNIVTL